MTFTLRKIDVVPNLKTGKKGFNGAKKPKMVLPRLQTQNPLYKTFLGSVERKMVPHRTYETF
jgi:hypothetical protein